MITYLLIAIVGLLFIIACQNFPRGGRQDYKIQILHSICYSLKSELRLVRDKLYWYDNFNSADIRDKK